MFLKFVKDSMKQGWQPCVAPPCTKRAMGLGAVDATAGTYTSRNARGLGPYLTSRSMATVLPGGKESRAPSRGSERCKLTDRRAAQRHGRGRTPLLGHSTVVGCMGNTGCTYPPCCSPYGISWTIPMADCVRCTAKPVARTARSHGEDMPASSTCGCRA